MSAILRAVESAVKRPVLRYHGGKWKLAPWLISHFPPHRTYVEPFAGAASVLLRKQRSYAEVINDLDGEIMNLFQVLRDAAAASELQRLLHLTPYHRQEFEAAYQPSFDPVERARRTVVRSLMGFGSASATSASKGFLLRGVLKRAGDPELEIAKPGPGFRNDSNRSGTTPAHDWRNYPKHIPDFVDRLRGVVIENRPAAQVIRTFDRETSLFYCDPPYPMNTRDSGTDYRHEMSDEDHRDLARVLKSVEAMAIVSGYACRLYDEELYGDWFRSERAVHIDGARKRTEVLWLNRSAHKALESSRSQLHFFSS